MLAKTYILKDRTYNEKEGDGYSFKCYDCGAELMYTDLSPRRVKYCFNCGKKVILRSAYETIEENNKEMD